MLMLMARRELTDGAFGARLMLSADPLMGKSGYPLLFQTGESADGHTPLIDRQHPHDLLMEAALTYSHELNKDGALFVYAGLPGEPALGTADLHAPAVGHGQPGSTARASLARLHPHQLGCRDRRLHL